jgi:hypothetical protein
MSRQSRTSTPPGVSAQIAYAIFLSPKVSGQNGMMRDLARSIAETSPVPRKLLMRNISKA